MTKTNRVAAAIVMLLLGSACSDGVGPEDLFHVHGVVLNNTSRAPAPGITVEAYEPGGCGFFGCSPDRSYKTTKTDASGRFSLDFSEGEGACFPFAVRAESGSSKDFGTFDDNGRCSPKGEVIEVTLVVYK
jgi:hypothetical protein